MRVVLILVLALVAFVLGVVGPLAVTGQLDTALNVLRGQPEDAETSAELPEAADPVSDLARALQQRETDLDEHAAALDARETRLNLRQSELDRQAKNLAEMRASIEKALDQLDAAQQQGLEEVARSLAVMDPDEAGADLERMDPVVAARILPLIPRDERGPILDAIMDKERRVQILDLMHARTN